MSEDKKYSVVFRVAPELPQGGRTLAVHGVTIQRHRRFVTVGGLNYRYTVPWDNVAYIREDV